MSLEGLSIWLEITNDLNGNEVTWTLVDFNWVDLSLKMNVSYFRHLKCIQSNEIHKLQENLENLK